MVTTERTARVRLVVDGLFPPPPSGELSLSESALVWSPGVDFYPKTRSLVLAMDDIESAAIGPRRWFAIFAKPLRVRGLGHTYDFYFVGNRSLLEQTALQEQWLAALSAPVAREAGRAEPAAQTSSRDNSTSMRVYNGGWLFVMTALSSPFLLLPAVLSLADHGGVGLGWLILLVSWCALLVLTLKALIPLIIPRHSRAQGPDSGQSATQMGRRFP